MSQPKIRPKRWLYMRRLARQIPNRDAMDALLEGMTGEMRRRAIAQLKPHLSFVPTEETPTHAND